MGQAIGPDNHWLGLVRGSEKRSGRVGDNGVGAGEKRDPEETGRVAAESRHHTLTVADFKGGCERGVAGFVHSANRRDRPPADDSFEAGSSDVDAGHGLGGGASQHDDGERGETQKAVTQWLPPFLASERVV